MTTRPLPRTARRGSLAPCALVALLGVAGLAGCLDEDDKGDEADVPTEGDGKADSQRAPTDHGALAFGVPALEAITDAAKFHAWQFELSGDAAIDAFTTYAVRGQRRVDTVMYLYKEGPSGWGAYVARNDDDGSRVYSRIKRTLGQGRYRVLVKGYAATTRGRFAVELDCAGAGCAPPAGACVFGTSYRSAFETPALVAQGTLVLSLTQPAQISPFDHARIVTAVQQSSHTDVSTWEQAIARVDGGEINRTFLIEPAGQRTFVAYEYGAGDNSYGAIFDHHSGALVASIQDGDLAGCSVAAETCLLAPTYPALRVDPAYGVLADRYITSESQLEPREVVQALATVRAVRGDNVVSFAQALTMVDPGSLRFTTLLHLATGTELVAVEFGAGDTSVGRIYYGLSLQVAGQISDGSIEACSWFAARAPGASAAGQACRASSDCQPQLRCEGVFANAGTCVMQEEIPGDGNECASDAACGAPGLVCAGATRGYGLCRPAWMRASFADPSSAQVPDGGTVVRPIAVRGLATVDTDVVLSLRVSHPRASQLRITLTNPAGTEVLVHQGTAADDGAPLVLSARPIMGFSGDETVNGEWTLRVTDRTLGQVGTLDGWQLTITSRWD